MKFKDLPESVQVIAAQALKEKMLAPGSAIAAMGNGSDGVDKANGICDAFGTLYSQVSTPALAGELSVTTEARPNAPDGRPSEQAWPLLIKNQNGKQVCTWNASADVDTSGDAWRNGGHQTMAAVLYCLSLARRQAEVVPEDPGWVNPLNPFIGEFFLLGKKIVHAEAP